ncbi:hypothetical protein [Micromonospora sp. NPDC049662]|uniref:hypothetical protein n=1 Tax=Micromonospora sp. NPDC049662 TaxID=3155397 RepID=UPI003446A4C5
MRELSTRGLAVEGGLAAAAPNREAKPATEEQPTAIDAPASTVTVASNSVGRPCRLPWHVHEHKQGCEENAEVADTNGDRYHRAELRILRVQAAMSALALVVAGAGAFVAYRAFTSQQQVIEEQQDFASEQREQDRRRNANLVAYWDERGEDGTVVTHLQNRSAAPLRYVSLLNFIIGGPPLAERRRVDREYFAISVVPPCSTIAITLDAAVTETKRWYVGGVLFGDPVGAWVKYDGVSEEINASLLTADSPVEFAPVAYQTVTYYDRYLGARKFPAQLERETSCG